MQKPRPDKREWSRREFGAAWRSAHGGGMERHLVLAGGGHAHVEVLRRLAGQHDPGLHVTLVNPEAASTYSGMLPGLIAGHYSRGEGRIDLAGLCQRAGARLVLGSVTGMDAKARALRLGAGSTLHWDLLSLNTGSTPDIAGAPGALRFATPIKPMSGFLSAWNRALEERRHFSPGPFHAVVVGAGAFGVEIALAIRHRLRETGASARVTLAGEHFLKGYARSVRDAVRRTLERAQVDLLEEVRATEVTASSVSFSGGEAVESQFTAWLTGPAAPAWMARSGLALDDRGFPVVDEFLQSKSDPRVFAAGDVASFEATVPKAGVYAVRQGPVLASNLLAVLRGTSLTPFVPPPRFLSLISLGGRRAIASWGELKAEGAIVWRLKRYIDRRFIRRYAGSPAGLATAPPH